VDQDLAKEEKAEEAPEISTLDQLSGAFNANLNESLNLIGSMSKNGLQRVIKVLLAYPLLHEDLGVTIDKEQEVRLAQLGVDIQHIKFSMTMESMGIDTKELAKEVDESKEVTKQEKE
jgi:hypothetical protein